MRTRRGSRGATLLGAVSPPALRGRVGACVAVGTDTRPHCVRTMLMLRLRGPRFPLQAKVNAGLIALTVGCLISLYASKGNSFRLALLPTCPPAPSVPGHNTLASSRDPRRPPLCLTSVVALPSLHLPYPRHPRPKRKVAREPNIFAASTYVAAQPAANYRCPCPDAASPAAWSHRTQRTPHVGGEFKLFGLREAPFRHVLLHDKGRAAQDVGRLCLELERLAQVPSLEEARRRACQRG